MEDRIATTAPTGARDRRLVTARVPLAPAPTAAPADLAGYVTEVRRDGVRGPVDWELDPARFAARAPVSDMASIARRFQKWRATWMDRFVLAEVPEVARLGAFAAAEGLGLLARLSAAAAVYDPAELDRLDDELATLPAPLEAARAHGWRFVDGSSHKVLRVVSAPGRLHGDPDADWEVVVVEGRGVRLRVVTDVLDVVGWTLSRSGVLVATGDGSDREVTGPAARGLAQLAPSSARVAVEQVPLAQVWGPVLDQLTSAVTSAVVADAAVVVAPER